jgi:Peptidase A4 family
MGTRTRIASRWSAGHSAIGLVALLAALAFPTAALAKRPRQQKSVNWAGYAVTAKASFTSASSQWVQPSATCDQPAPTRSAFWVGLGGFKHGSRALEQIGTEADCTGNGARRTYAWYELVPAAPVKLKIKVRPGDLLTGKVTVDGDLVKLHLANLRTGASFTDTVSTASIDTSSAEWIAEAPSECMSPDQCQPLPLADFGEVQFTHARASTAGGHVGTISDPAFSTTEVTLSGEGGGPTLGPGPVLAGSGSTLATPTQLSHHGGTFGVTFKQGSSAPVPPPFSASGRLRYTHPTRARSRADYPSARNASN